MARWARAIRKQVHPRAGHPARGKVKAPRASSIILGMLLVMLAVMLLAKTINYLFTAT
ncbi:MAG: hypothetical protein ACRECW_11090 [Phyllobacterium sp.]